jgi:CheY-like chemotaxis protein
MSSPSRPSDPAASRLVHVLLVENDPLIAMSVVDQLAELGYAVVGPAHSLAEGCRLAAEAPIDVALVDWNLDRTTAADVADILTKRQIPFAFVTGYAEIPEARYRDAALLRKPFAMEILGRTIEDLLGGAPAPSV